jgi:hypothetical protein
MEMLPQSSAVFSFKSIETTAKGKLENKFRIGNFAKKGQTLA